MFTGIIEELGTIKGIQSEGVKYAITISCKSILEDLKIGDSVAVNGVCLTATTISRNTFSADVMPETMKMSNLGQLNQMDKVGLERALRLSDRLGGHIVSGHIDGQGLIVEKVNDGNAVWIKVKVDHKISKYIIKKGSITVDGTSLTVASLEENTFKVSLIPLTRTFTTLGFKMSGASVNIECDMIGKYVAKLLGIDSHEGEKPKGISQDFLKAHGFI